MTKIKTRLKFNDEKSETIGEIVKEIKRLEQIKVYLEGEF